MNCFTAVHKKNASKVAARSLRRVVFYYIFETSVRDSLLRDIIIFIVLELECRKRHAHEQIYHRDARE